jgi:anti-sigma factor ChrR (cupin superfamily)
MIDRWPGVNDDRLIELAAGFAGGNLEAGEHEEFRALLARASAAVRAEVGQIIDAAALATLSTMPPASPLPSAPLRQRLLQRVRGGLSPSELLKFVRGGDEGWIALKVPGASVKLLSMEDDKDYSVVLGKLEPGARYPAHSHIGAEEVYILSGDLSIGDVKLVAGDFHHAAPGSSHDVNHSENGCTILAVLTKKDLMAQFAAGQEDN